MTERNLCRSNVQEADVQHAALGEDLDEGDTIKDTAGDELTARLGVDPAPGGGSGLATVVGVGRAERSVVDEVVQVNLASQSVSSRSKSPASRGQTHVLAPEGQERVARDSSSDTVNTFGVVETGPLGRVHQTGGLLGLPGLCATLSVLIPTATKFQDGNTHQACAS